MPEGKTPDLCRWLIHRPSIELRALLNHFVDVLEEHLVHSLTPLTLGPLSRLELQYVTYAHRDYASVGDVTAAGQSDRHAHG